MSRLVAVLAVLSLALLAAAPAAARDDLEPRTVLFGAPGFFDGGDLVDTLHFGAGVEGVAPSGFGLAIDGGYLAPVRWFGGGVGTVSPGLLYEIRLEEGFDLFFRGGYTMWFREGAAHFAHFGGGIHHPIGESTDLKVEARFYASGHEDLGDLFEIRFGVVLF